MVDIDGKVSDPSFDLYNQAFALLAYASGHRAFGEAGCWRRQAVALRTTLEQSYAHPRGGFLENRRGQLPRRSNPHMHLLEAALAWIALDDDPGWRHMADSIATLCLEKFMDPATGALREFFADDWSPASGVKGHICEPGHHYEWAFLLHRWAQLTGRNAPEAAPRLIAFADSRGLDARRGVAINAVLADGGVHDPVARLWAQAERIRVYAAHRRSDDEVAAAIKGLRRFLATPTEGLWFDQLGADDVFILEPARATSLYHIIGAVAELSHALPAAASDSVPASNARGPAPRVIYLVTEDWYFISHRLPMARACMSQLALTVTALQSRLKGFICIPSLGAAAALIRAILFGSCARCASFTASSIPISPTTSHCRQPSSDRSPPLACPSFASML